MNRRAFLSTLAALPFMGWVKPTPAPIGLFNPSADLAAQFKRGVLRSGDTLITLRERAYIFKVDPPLMIQRYDWMCGQVEGNAPIRIGGA